MRWSLNPYAGPWPLASSPEMTEAMARAVGAQMFRHRRRTRPPTRSAAYKCARQRLSRQYRRDGDTRGRIPRRHRLSWRVNCERDVDRGARRS